VARHRLFQALSKAKRPGLFLDHHCSTRMIIQNTRAFCLRRKKTALFAIYFAAGAAAGAAAARLRPPFAGAAFFAAAVEGPLAVLRAFKLACSAVFASAA